MHHDEYAAYFELEARRRRTRAERARRRRALRLRSYPVPVDPEFKAALQRAAERRN